MLDDPRDAGNPQHCAWRGAISARRVRIHDVMTHKITKPSIKVRVVLELGLGITTLIGVVLACLPLFVSKSTVEIILAASLSGLALLFFITAFIVVQRLAYVTMDDRRRNRWTGMLSELSTVLLRLGNAAVYRHDSAVEAAFQNHAA